jgi:hypothetical protein
MRPILLALIALAAIAAEPVATTAAPVERTAPLVVNLTSADPHRAQMAIGFALAQIKRGHPTTVYLNDQGVRVAASAGGDALAAHRTMLGELVQAGGTILACPMCTAHCGLEAGSYIAGVTMSSPERIEAALFAPGARSLSW